MMNKLNNFTPLIFFILILVACVSVGIFLSDTPASPEQIIETKASFSDRSSLLRTNTWFSNVYKKFPTEPLFALPGAYKFDTAGLVIGFPKVVGTPATVFGSFSPFCSVGMSSATTAVKVVRSGDWDATFEVESGSIPWQVTIAQGSPVTTIENLQGPLSINCEGDVVSTMLSQGLLLTRGTQSMLIEGKGTVALEKETNIRYTLLSTDKIYRIILLPEKTAVSSAFFSELPWDTLTGTEAIYTETNSKLVTSYHFQTRESQPVLTTLWPHHELIGESEVLGEYLTSTGTLRLIKTASFATTTEIPALPTSFERVSDEKAVNRIQEAVRQDLALFKKDTPPGGVYFLGTWLGGLTSVLELAYLYGMESEREQLLDLLQNNLLGSLKNFTYREDLHMLVAKNTEFGNDEGNDHHFHYGYYLRSATVLVSLRPELRGEIVPVMDELAKDIATTDRTSTRYPYIRNFSPYDGHSWADGYSNFGDGNNQESTSEALNAWYSLLLWGEVTGNVALVKMGRALFATELSSVKAYWFGENNPFPEGYQHTIASIVWGGKRDYATWFSGEAMHIHGIQWLPITPASGYLESLPAWEVRKEEILRAHPNPAGHEWGDLYTATLSFKQPEEALRLLPEAQKNRAMKSTALLLHTVYSNLENSR